VLSININNDVINLSVTFKLQLPFDDCPTVAAACSSHRQCVTHCRWLLQRQWDSRRVCVCVCAITDSLL